MGEESDGPRSRQTTLGGEEPPSVPATVARVISPEAARVPPGTSVAAVSNGDRPPPPRSPELRSPGLRPPKPWATVIATTVRLWARRHFSRKRWILGSRKRWILGLLILVLAAAAATLSLIVTRHPTTTAPAASRGPGSGTRAAGSGGAGPGAAQETSALRHEAVAWVAAQVSRDAIVSCDPAICLLLQAQGFPAANLLVLRPSAQDPLGSDIVVETAALRTRLGSRLASVDAPEVIASFRSGTQRIDIRAVAPDGAAAYRAALRSDRKDRRMAGAQLLRNPRLSVAKAARKQLAAGRVDSRLLITLAALAAHHRLRIAAFAGSAPGASAGIPLRSVYVSATGPRAANGAAVLQSVSSFLLAQRQPYLPANVRRVALAGGHAALWVEFGAPSQLGLLTAHGIP
jgi:hypothetical protein